ncbi:type I restriction-modification system subunit M [Acetobacteraceae bacterium]|nr:type I restriction-modification system subunit M [Acetobacteraceae bacterium]
MKMQINQDTINSKLWDACDIFRGTVSADTYKDYILTLLFLKYLSDVWQDHLANYQKEYSNNPELVKAMMEQENFVLPEGSDFESLFQQRDLPGNGERIDKALAAIESANGQKLKLNTISIFNDIRFNSEKLGEEKLKNELLSDLLGKFHDKELDLRPSRVGNLDIIGNAYEFLIGKFAAGSGQKAGEYYTPAEVSDLLAQLLAPQVGDKICDPTCGSGSLLLKCGREVSKNHNKSKDYALFGQEAILSTCSLAIMNMFLHGENNHQIEWGDTIRSPKLLDSSGRLKKFDIVTANPPFSLKEWGANIAENDPHSRFSRGIPPKTKGDYAFLLHMVESLNDRGRMGVVVPHGVLFRGAAEGKIRKKLVEENLLEAVIGLPEKLFFGTGIPAAILIFNKEKKDEKVLFIDASKEFEDGKNQNKLGKENLEKIVQTYRNRQEVEKYAHLASLEEIQENAFNLNIPRYVDMFEEEAEIDLQEVLKERKALTKSLAAIESEMEKYLKELGYHA